MSTNAPFLLTGASSGIGFGAACALVAHRPLILPVRSAARGPALQAALRAVNPAAQIETPVCDLASLAAVGALVAAVRSTAPPLAGIACIAGVQIVQGLQRSADGHELTFAVHHLAHCQLVLGLLDHLAPAAPVLFVGSSTHDGGDFWARLFGFRGGHFSSVPALARGETPVTGSDAARGNARYATAKLCNLMTMFALAREWPAEQVRFCAVDPGLVPGTGLARDNNAFNRAGWSAMRVGLPWLPGVSTPERSGATIAWALTTPALAGRTGVHLNSRRVETATSLESRDPALGARLLAETRALLLSTSAS